MSILTYCGVPGGHDGQGPWAEQGLSRHRAACHGLCGGAAVKLISLVLMAGLTEQFLSEGECACASPDVNNQSKRNKCACVYDSGADDSNGAGSHACCVVDVIVVIAVVVAIVVAAVEGMLRVLSWHA